MSLTKKLIAGTFALASIFNNGCSTMPERNFPEGHISGVEYNKISHEKVPYKLEDQIIYGRRYYMQETANASQSLPIIFYPWESASRELDLDSKEIKLTSKEMYIPVLVEREKKGEDKFADGIALTSEGKYGTRAYMTSPGELRNREGISEGSYNYKIISTENDAVFMIQATKILGEEYFITFVEDKKVNEKGKLPFYMVPVKGAKIRIDNICGNLSIWNENQIYRPALISESELRNRDYNHTEELLSIEELQAVPTTESSVTLSPTPKRK